MRPAFAAALMFVHAAQGAEAFSTRSETPRVRPEQTLEDVDKRVESFKGMIWTATQRAILVSPDHTGTTLERDLEKHVFTDQSLALLKELRGKLAKAFPAGSSLIPAAALAPLNDLMDAENCRFWAITSYWQVRHGIAYHEDLIRALVDRIPTAASPDTIARLQALGAQRDGLRARMELVLPDCSVAGATRFAAEIDLVKPTEYNLLRSDIATDLPRYALGTIYVKRSSPCPPPVASAPRMRLVSRPELADFYPEEAVEYQVEGKVTVAIEYDPAGCVTRAAVLKTSGADILDKAGLEYGFGLVLQPGEENGRAIGGAASQNITFSLLDRPAGVSSSRN
jgi:TonB family protein